jgi:hypothetical protein
MEKQNIIRAVTFAVIFFVFVWWGSSGFPTEYQVCEITNNGEHCGSYNILFGLVWKSVLILDRYGALITALATIAIAWFTLTLRRSTDRLWEAGEKQIAVAAKSAEAALKHAQIAEKSFGMSSQADFGLIGQNPTQVSPNQRLTAGIKLKNFGSAAAYNVSGRVKVEITDPATRKFEIKMPDPKRLIVEGKGDRVFEGTTDNPVTPKQIIDIESGKLGFFLIGAFRYESPIGNPGRVITVCIRGTGNLESPDYEAHDSEIKVI